MQNAHTMTGAARPRQAGCLYLFQAFGVPVFVHWTWGLVAAFIVAADPTGLGSMWGLAVLLGLFGIVTLHEFGHALAALSVGGRADRIVLNLLGGVAYTRPPARPWPTLWSVAAGPLVNVALVPVLVLLAWGVGAMPTVAADGTVVFGAMTGLQACVVWLASANVVLLLFNLLPVFPLDGGQMLQAVLWMFMGRARSLTVSSMVGLIASIGLGAMMLVSGAVLNQPFLFVIAVFIAWSCFKSLMVANLLAQLERMQGRHVEPWELRGGAVRSGVGPGFGGGAMGGGAGSGARGGDVIEGEVVDRR